MKGDKYYVITDLGGGESTLDVLDTKDELQDFLKQRKNIEDITIIEGRRLIPEYKFYYKLKES